MTTLPTITKDANGIPTMVGVGERITTQAQVDYTDATKSAQLIGGAQGVQARYDLSNASQILTKNPTVSPGLLAALTKSGALPNNSLTSTLVQIDAATQAQRATDQRTQTLAASNAAFQNQWYGKLWTGLKSVIRDTSTPFFDTVNFANQAFRSEINTDKAYLSGKVDFWTGKPTNPTDTRASLGLVSDPQANMFSNLAKEVGNDYKSTVTYQAMKLLGETGNPGLGSGFMPSEMTGAGAAARKEQEKFLKVPVMQNGNIAGYRPYGIFDPLGYVLSGGHPESDTAQIVSAIGDLGLQFVLDPTLAFGKLAAAARDARLSGEATTGLLAAKNFQQADLLKTQLVSQKAEVAKQLKQIGIDISKGKDALISDYRAAVAKATQLKDQYGNPNLDYDALGTFLSGAVGKHIFSSLANIDDYKVIRKLSGGQLTVDQSVALAAAKTPEDVARVIAPYIAGGTVSQRVFETGTSVGRTVSKPFDWVLSKGPMPTAVGALTNATARLATRTGVAQAAGKIAFKYNTHLPTGVLVASNDKDKIIDSITDLGSYLKLPQREIEKITDKIAYAPAGEAGYHVTDLLNKVFDMHAGDFNPETIPLLRNATRLYETEKQQINMYWANQHLAGAQFDMINLNGKMITVHGAHLDSELHNGYTYIPNGKEIVAAIRSQKILGNTRTDLIGAADILNGVFKKSVLMRPAYIMRNIVEEQIRAAATGHVTFLNHPVSALAAWLGRPGGSKTKAVLNLLDKTRHDVYGRDFKSISAKAELHYEATGQHFGNEYNEFMADGGFGQMGDGVMHKSGSTVGYAPVMYGHDRWWEGYSSQLRILHNSELARKVAETVPGQEAKTVKYFTNGPGRPTLDKMIRAKQEGRSTFDTSLGSNGINFEKDLRTYLFDGVNKAGENVSVAGRVAELAGKDGLAAPKIKELIAKGKVTVGNNVIDISSMHNAVKDVSKSKNLSGTAFNGAQAINKEMAFNLKSAFEGNGNWDGVFMNLPSQVKTAFENSKSLFNTIPQKFFDVSSNFEKTSTMGPEWRQAYWDAIGRISGAINWEAKSELLPKIGEDLGKLKSAETGKNIPVPDSLTKAMGKDTNGSLTRDEAHKYASSYANKHVEDLFYNATKRKLFYHQLRLIAPFSQAWENTISAWSKIAMNNPLQVYKGMKVLNWLNSSESGALYKMTDAKDYYDPNQGFFYTDPNTGDQRFFVPYAAAAINILSGEPSLRGPYAMSASPSSFNFATGQNSVMPGFGPGISIPIGVLDGLNKNPLHVLPIGLESLINGLIFPYGPPDIQSQGVINSAFLSGNWNKIAGVAANQKASFAAAFAPSLTYLANSGGYNLDDIADKNKLAGDAYNMAKWFTFMRGIFGGFTPIPISMRPDALAKSKDGNTILAVSLFNDFKNIEKQNGYMDKSASYGKFWDLYGPQQFFAIVNTTANMAPDNLLTYAMLKNHPEVLDKYPDTYGSFYPDGELSIALKSWQKVQGNFTKMTPKEIMAEVTKIKYYAASNRVDATSIGENWDAHKKAAVMKALTESYQMSGMSRTVSPDKIAAAIDQFRTAVNDPALADSDAVNGLRDYLAARDAALGGTANNVLGSKATLDQREWLATQALEILGRHPQFQKIFYSYFKKELGK